jgi:hypothetical protein
VDDGTVHGPSFNRETSNANQPFKEMMEPTYYTASVDSNSMAGQVSHQVIKSSSPRQVMRLPRALKPLEALISVFRHMNGHDPKLVAKRLVADRFWKYAEKYQ